jgi:hypothetical protein
MKSEQEALIRVHGAWNGWRTAEVRLADLEHIHWLQPDRAPRQLVHGHILCRDLVSGDIPHECEGTPGPHRLLVCVIKNHNTAAVYAEVARRADDAFQMSQGAVPARRHVQRRNSVRPPWWASDASKRTFHNADKR